MQKSKKPLIVNIVATILKNTVDLHSRKQT